MGDGKNIFLKIRKILNISGKKKNALIAIAIASVMVVSTLGVIAFLLGPKPAYYNPDISLNVKFISNNSASYNVYSPQNPFFTIHTPFNTYNMSNITVDIYGSMPSFENSGDQSVNVTGPLTNNSVYSQVFNSTGANSNGQITGTLNNAFHRIIIEYRSIYTLPQEKTISISLTMQADYQFIYHGKMYVYTYYNNIPFNPWSNNFGNSRYAPYIFKAMIYFDMQKQPIVTPINTTNTLVYKEHPNRQIGGGVSPPKCNNIVKSHVYQYWGPLPIVMGNIPLNSTSVFPFDYNIIHGKYSVSFSSSAVTSSSTQEVYTQLSSSGNSAWSDSAANFVYSGTLSGIPSVSSPTYLENISMIGYGHFEYQLTVTTTTYLFVDGSNCAYGSTATTAIIKLINGNNGTFDYEAGFLVNLFNVPESNNSQFMNYDWKQFFDAGLSQDASYNIPAGSYKDLINVSFLATDFQTAASKAVNSLNNMALLWAGVSLGLTIAAIIAAPLTGGTSLLVLSFTSSGLITGTAALGTAISASIISSQNPTMEVSTAENNVTTIEFSNQVLPYATPNNMIVNLYQCGIPVTQYINGTPYTYYIQSSYLYAYT
ncbi:hypothetical protein ACNF40_03890 [Cuniculiplasma sp. SKW4]|uniref:hypothetical protein n=1 Tax=Cuniculiplasma sp. SKW4 TaxID=3400171 RepID=UPI003FD4709F